MSKSLESNSRGNQWSAARPRSTFGESFTCPTREIRFGCRDSGQACPKADLRTATSAVCSNSHKLATNPVTGLPRIPNGRDDAIEAKCAGARPVDHGRRARSSGTNSGTKQLDQFLPSTPCMVRSRYANVNRTSSRRTSVKHNGLLAPFKFDDTQAAVQSWR